MAISSVGAIICDFKGKVLLQKRDVKKSIYFPGLWGVFGGACDKNERPSEAIIRETSEELQVNIAPPKLFLTMEIQSLVLGSQHRKRHFY
jgi:ADP-ribose pyrophosphatase YjhB (NUDIX family)